MDAKANLAKSGLRCVFQAQLAVYLQFKLAFIIHFGNRRTPPRCNQSSYRCRSAAKSHSYRKQGCGNRSIAAKLRPTPQQTIYGRKGTEGITILEQCLFASCSKSGFQALDFNEFSKAFLRERFVEVF